MAAKMKSNIWLMLFLTFALHACGQESGSPEASVAMQEADAEYAMAPVGDTHCTETVPPAEAPMAYCKALDDGSTHTVLLKPSIYVQDHETCVITVVDDGMKETLLEMDFEPCEI